MVNVLKSVVVLIFALLVATLAAGRDEQPPPDPVVEAQKLVDVAKMAKEQADKDVTKAIEKVGEVQVMFTELKMKFDDANAAVPKLREDLRQAKDDAELAEASAEIKKDKVSRGLAEAARAAVNKAQTDLTAKENEVVEVGKQLTQASKNSSEAQRELFLAQGAQQKAADELVAARLAKAEVEGKMLSEELKKLKENPPKAGLSDKDVEKLVEAKFKAEQDKVAAAQAKAIDAEFKKRLGEGKIVILTADDVRKIIGSDLADQKTPLGALAKEVSELKALAAELGDIKEEINKLKPGKEPTVRGNPNPTPPQPMPMVTPQPVPLPQPVPVVAQAPKYLLLGGVSGPVYRHESGREYRRLLPGESLPAGLPRCPLPPGAEIFVPR